MKILLTLIITLMCSFTQADATFRMHIPQPNYITDDWDGDGMPNATDPDDDNDGILDEDDSTPFGAIGNSGDSVASGITELIVEVTGSESTITEIEAYDINDNQLTLTISSTRDYSDSSLWDDGSWGGMHLTDGNIIYYNNTSGKISTTIFNYPDTFRNARFHLSASADIKYLQIWVGSTEGRKPDYITFYTLKSNVLYDEPTHLTGNDDSGLDVNQIFDTSSVSGVPSMYQIDL